MRPRHVAAWIGAVAAAGVLALTIWDALKLDRKAPRLVPREERAAAILVEKAARRLTLLRDGSTLKAYDVSLDSAPIGHKRQEGDGRTPEGHYQIDFKNARSRFHLALRISYPDAQDRDGARRRGLPPGGDIMIHGLPRGLGWLGKFHLMRDWTDGCIAVTNGQIEEIWAMVDVGTAVEIRP
jgi:murein L,D-transpeptidase YafK